VTGGLVTIDPKHVTPSSEKDPSICIQCLKLTARWRVGKIPEVTAWCSHCMLYKTEWGEKNAQGIAKLVGAVQVEMGRIISDENGIVLEEEADRIMTSIRLISGSRMVLNRLNNR
jgi:hypothetical protein